MLRPFKCGPASLDSFAGRRNLQSGHDLLDHGLKAVKVQPLDTPSLSLPTTYYIQDLIPAAIDQLVNLFRLLSPGLPDTLLDLPGNLRTPRLQLLPEALPIGGLIRHVVSEEVDLQSLNTILEDNDRILARIENKKYQEKACEKDGRQKNDLHGSTHLEFRLRHKQNRCTGTLERFAEHKEHTGIFRLHHRLRSGLALDIRPALLHARNEGITEGLVGIQDQPTPFRDHGPPPRRNHGGAQEIVPEPGGGDVEQRGPLNYPKAVFG